MILQRPKCLYWISFCWKYLEWFCFLWSQYLEWFLLPWWSQENLRSRAEDPCPRTGIHPPSSLLEHKGVDTALEQKRSKVGTNVGSPNYKHPLPALPLDQSKELGGGLRKEPESRGLRGHLSLQDWGRGVLEGEAPGEYEQNSQPEEQWALFGGHQNKEWTKRQEEGSRIPVQGRQETRDNMLATWLIPSIS